MGICESGITIIGSTANFLSNLGVIVVALFVIGFIVCLRYSFCRANEKWETEKREHIRQTSQKNYPWQCLLIDGVWGSGKTTHYEKHYQYIDNQPNIYISCFSASRSELIAQIIQQQFWCQLLTLNGLLAKLMESNWRIFMPKKRVIVFDDLERLHANQDNYLDLIGIIDYLKDKMGCKIILICNMLELKEPIFNIYMERIVDEVAFPILLPKNEFIKNLINEPNELTQKLLGYLYVDYESGKINNLRIIKNIMPMIAKKLEDDYSEFNEVDQILNASLSELRALINKYYLFYIDNTLFKVCSNLKNGKIRYDQTNDDRDKYYANLQSKLNQFSLNHDDFNCKEYNTFRDIRKILDLNLNDYLQRDISRSLDANNSGEVIYKVNEYLSKCVSQQTCNEFNADYVLYLTFIVWTAKVGNYQKFFNEILSIDRLMNKDTFKPERDNFGVSNPLFHLYEWEKYYQIFGISSKIDEGVDKNIDEFEIEYCLFYRNKVINKFVESTNKVLWEQVNLFADGWFIRCCNEQDKNVLYLLLEDISIVKDLYNKSNRYLNLNIIKKWIDNKVEPNTLLEYYAKVLAEFEIEKSREVGKSYLLDWLLLDKNEADPKVKEKFATICEKFTKLNEMIKSYVDNNYSTQYDSLVKKYEDLIKKLEITER